MPDRCSRKHISIPTGTIKSQIPLQILPYILVISIPTGTIKRMQPLHSCILLLISIPTGTIKRNPLHFRKNVIRISIPTGTIKRDLSLKEKDLLMKFQFLLVRLKGFAAIS